MNLEIKVARTEKELERAFNLRYRIFGKECGYLNLEEYSEKIEKDYYDNLASTTNFVALDSGVVVGTTRIIRANSNLGLAIEDLVDINSLRKEDIVLAEASRLCVDTTHRSKRSVSSGLCKIAICHSISEGITDYCILANSTDIKTGNTVDFFTKLGFQQFSDEIFYEKFNEWAIPMRLKLSEVTGPFLSWFRRPTSFIQKPFDSYPY